jgi:vacuolar-type H+-ATPase subunit I/STV1
MIPESRSRHCLSLSKRTSKLRKKGLSPWGLIFLAVSAFVVGFGIIYLTATWAKGVYEMEEAQKIAEERAAAK